MLETPLAMQAEAPRAGKSEWDAVFAAMTPGGHFRGLAMKVALGGALSV